MSAYNFLYFFHLLLLLSSLINFILIYYQISNFFYVFSFVMLDVFYYFYLNKMEMTQDYRSDMYEVEKIINCKTFKNKKFYLVKWLCYPINQSTWEPKSNLKHLNSLIEEFERGYPYSIDQEMFNKFCEEEKKVKKSKNKNKTSKENENEIKFTAKKRKIEYFSDNELNDLYLDKLKTHLHININKNPINCSKSSNDDLIIDLSSTTCPSEDIFCNAPSEVSNLIDSEEKMHTSKLIMPKME